MSTHNTHFQPVAFICLSFTVKISSPNSFLLSLLLSANQQLSASGVSAPTPHHTLPKKNHTPTPASCQDRTRCCLTNRPLLSGHDAVFIASTVMFFISFPVIDPPFQGMSTVNHSSALARYNLLRLKVCIRRRVSHPRHHYLPCMTSGSRSALHGHVYLGLLHMTQLRRSIPFSESSNSAL